MLSRLKNKKGFTLLELVVTMGFFALVSVGIMSLLIQNMKLVSYTQTQASGMTIAFNKWSQLLSAPYASVVNEARTALGDGHDREIVVTEQILPDNSKQKNVRITVYKTGGEPIYSLNEIKSQVAITGGDGTPSKMIGYFDTGTCPVGWSPYTALNGRTILSSGQSTANYATSHVLGSTGGEEKHLQTINEMPSHNHGYVHYTVEAPWDGGYGVQGGGTGTHREPHHDLTSFTGGGQPFNVMMPYLTLLACQKQ